MVRDSEGERDLFRNAVHRIDIAGIDGYRFISQMFKGGISQIEMNTLDQHVCTDEDFFIAIIQDGCVVSNPFKGRGIL